MDLTSYQILQGLLSCFGSRNRFTVQKMSTKNKYISIKLIQLTPRLKQHKIRSHASIFQKFGQEFDGLTF